MPPSVHYTTLPHLDYEPVERKMQGKANLFVPFVPRQACLLGGKRSGSPEVSTDREICIYKCTNFLCNHSAMLTLRQIVAGPVSVCAQFFLCSRLYVTLCFSWAIILNTWPFSHKTGSLQHIRPKPWMISSP